MIGSRRGADSRIGSQRTYFDGFAEKLTDDYHVYGMTRRGFGASSRPESGYTEQRRGEDVARVLDSLNLVAPVLIGHSWGGQAMTALAAAHPERIRGLVYLNGVVDPTVDWEPYQELRSKLPAAMRVQPPTAADRSSFQAYRDWQRRNQGIAFPESALRNAILANPDGSMGSFKTPARISTAISDGMQKPDFSHVRVPVLALFSLPEPLEDQFRCYHTETAEERTAMERVYATALSYVRSSIDNLKLGAPTLASLS